MLNARLNRFQEHHCSNRLFRAIVLRFLSRNRIKLTYMLKIHTKVLCNNINKTCICFLMMLIKETYLNGVSNSLYYYSITGTQTPEF